MKQALALLIISLLCCVVLAGCSPRSDGASSESEATSSIASQLPQPSSSSESPAPSSEPTAAQPSEPDNTETATFALGDDAQSEMLMSVGDHIGDWTLADLQIQRDNDNNINRVNALFNGEVALQGTLSRSVLLEDGFDFRVAKGDGYKMPCYISPDAARYNGTAFMLNIPENIAATLALEHGEKKIYTITVSDYQYYFAYSMAPAGATVVSMEDMPDAQLSYEKLIGYLDFSWGYEENHHEFWFNSTMEIENTLFYVFDIYFEGELRNSFAISVDTEQVFCYDENSGSWVEELNPDHWEGW